MLRGTSVVALLVPLVLVPTSGAFAQDRALGQRLFEQSCVVCHKIPQLGATAYAPALSMNTLGGNADAIHQVISDGTTRMPAFKIQFTPTQLDAIVAYIKTIPAPPAAPTPAKAKGAGGPD
jgi:mono/diheme cytochrome c family protein